MAATDFVIRDLLEGIRATLDTLPSTRFVPYWKMRARAFGRVLDTWAAQAPSPAQREGLLEAVAALRSEIARSSGQEVLTSGAHPIRTAS